MGNVVTNTGNDNDLYYPSSNSNNDDESKDDDNWFAPVAILGIIGFIVTAYNVNKQLLENDVMGEGRRYNDDSQNNRKYAISIRDLEALPEFERKELETKYPYLQRMYRTHNIVYPDIMYEGVRKQPTPDNVYINHPIPPSDEIEFQYAEPSNIVTDKILYEQGTPDLREDLRLTRKLGIGAGGNTFITTEYAPGLNEKLRRDNPVVVSKPVVTPDGRVVRKVGRMKPIEKTHKRRFNKDFDELGRPLQIEDPIYDTIDELRDLRLTNEDYGYGETGGKVSRDLMSAYEDFIVKGKLREGYEIIPSED